jgi:tRNA (adenine37-N6)-methyltransferase
MLTLEPIGLVYTDMEAKFAAPHQPCSDGELREGGVVKLFPGRNFEQALRDLEGFSRIWLIWWFHRNSSWRPMVLPPRGKAKRRGVFATRSPHRPNPIGITCVKLLRIEQLSLYVGELDLVNETPILDIKPYLPEVDAFTDEKTGWVQSVAEEHLKKYSIEINHTALEQLEWLKATWQVDFFERARSLLEVDPTPHRTRRIKKISETIFRMSCGGWRIDYLIDRATVLVVRIFSGYPERMLLDTEKFTKIEDRRAHIDFQSRYGSLL